MIRDGNRHINRSTTLGWNFNDEPSQSELAISRVTDCEGWPLMKVLRITLSKLVCRQQCSSKLSSANSFSAHSAALIPHRLLRYCLLLTFASRPINEVATRNAFQRLLNRWIWISYSFGEISSPSNNQQSDWMHISCDNWIRWKLELFMCLNNAHKVRLRSTMLSRFCIINPFKGKIEWI